ncbi:hypothetical protein DFO53_3183 [Enterobacter sp. AG5470]|nr:hypothetical protein DFO53_3183 [Enterobacter sp. AG5470]
MMQERGLDVIYVLQNFASEFEKYYVIDPAIVARNLYVAVKAACYYWDPSMLMRQSTGMV